MLEDPRDTPRPRRRGRSPLVNGVIVGAAVFLVALPILVAGIYLGGHPNNLPDGVRDALVDDGEAQTLDGTLDLIERDYYRKVKRAQLFDRSLGELVDGLRDQFSAYYTPKEYSALKSLHHRALRRHRPHGGRGQTRAQGQQRLPGLAGPARRAAAGGPDHPGGRAVARRPLLELLDEPDQGPAGHERDADGSDKGRTRTLTLRREEISIPAADAEVVTRGDTKLAHLRLTTFSSGVHGEARSEIDAARKRGAKGIVLDMRGNGGGLLSEARLVGSIFIPEGTVVVTRSRARGERTYRATGSAIPRDVPVVTLVDRATASASEIVAGALQDTRRARVVGTRTFGKGVFQEVVELPNNGALEITVGEFFLPGGRNLGGGGVRRGAGIRPDVTASDKPGTERDEALEAAYRELLART